MWKSSWDPHTSHVDPLWTLSSCLPITYSIPAGFALTRARWFFLYLTRSPEESLKVKETPAQWENPTLLCFVLDFLHTKTFSNAIPWEWVFTTLFWGVRLSFLLRRTHSSGSGCGTRPLHPPDRSARRSGFFSATPHPRGWSGGMPAEGTGWCGGQVGSTFRLLSWTVSGFSESKKIVTLESFGIIYFGFDWLLYFIDVW